MKLGDQNLRAPVRLAHLIRVTQRGFYRGMLLRLAEREIPLGHWVVLRMLWESRRLTQREMSAQSGLRESTLFVALKGMEELDLIERRVNPRNRREIYISLTKKGQALEKNLLPIAYEMNEMAVQGLSQTEIAALWHALEILIKNFEADEAKHLSENRTIPSTRKMALYGRDKPKKERAKKASKLAVRSRSGR